MEMHMSAFKTINLNFWIASIICPHDVNILNSYLYLALKKKCCQYLECYDKLYETSLPPYCAFYSTLRKANVLESEYNEWVKSKPASSTDLENYDMLLGVWKVNNMQTLKEFWIYYNALEEIPFCQAVQKMIQLHNTDSVTDLFEISVFPSSMFRYILFDIIHNQRERESYIYFV